MELKKAMGSWGEGNFENDDALDWVYDLENSKGLNTLLFPLYVINSYAEYLSLPDCCEALAASEIIAASLSGDFSNIPEEAKFWLDQRQGLFGKKPKITEDNALSAKTAIEKIVYDSELKDLWEESDHFDDWLKVQNDLLEKIINLI